MDDTDGAWEAWWNQRQSRPKEAARTLSEPPSLPVMEAIGSQ